MASRLITKPRVTAGTHLPPTPAPHSNPGSGPSKVLDSGLHCHWGRKTGSGLSWGAGAQEGMWLFSGDILGSRTPGKEARPLLLEVGERHIGGPQKWYNKDTTRK